MTFIQSIFLNIAKRLGLDLAEKKVNGLDYFEVDNISLTATIASRIATITLIDSDVNVAGDNQRAQALNDILQEMEDTQLKTAIEVALGTGDCLIKPYTDGQDIGYTLIPSPNFRVVQSIGNKIKSCLVKADQVELNNHVYERVEYYSLTEREGVSILSIKQMAFRDGMEIPLTQVDRWADIKDVEIPNLDRMLFGRIKCPMVNRGDINSINGVPVTYGMDKVLDNAVSAYDRFNQEMEDKETMIFADKTLLKKDKDNNFVLPPNKRKLFQSMRGGVDSSQLIHEYSPDIRDTSLNEGIQQNFKMLELLAGLSAGILTPPTSNFATATEMKANLQMSFAFIQAIRRSIENCIEDVIYATNAIMNRNNITPMGAYEIVFNWSDSYIENMAERFTALLQGEAIGAVDRAEVRAFIQNEPLDLAKEKVDEIAEPTGIE